MKAWQPLGIAVLTGGLVLGMVGVAPGDGNPGKCPKDQGAGKPSVQERKDKPTSKTPEQKAGVTGESRKRRGGGAGNPGEGLVRELGLDKEKAAAIKSLMETAREGVVRLQTEREQARDALEQLMAAEPVDEKAVLTAARKLADIQREMLMQRIKTRLAISRQLTPEQRAKMRECRRATMQKWNQAEHCHTSPAGSGPAVKAKPGAHGKSQGGAQPAKDQPKATGTEI